MTYRTRTEWLKKGLYVIPHAKPTAKTNKGESLFKRSQVQYSFERRMS